MKSFLRNLLSTLISVVFAYFVSYLCLMFSRSGQMDVMQELFYLYLHPTSGGLFLRILFPVSWIGGYVYMSSRFSVNRDIKSEWTNRMLHRPYSYPEERRAFWRGGEFLPLLLVSLLVGLLCPAFKLYGPGYLIVPVRILILFWPPRIFLALNRYVWCRDRLGGLEAKEAD